MIKHTPGPWHFEEMPGGIYEICIASGAWLLECRSASNPTEEERQIDEANMRLASAAPELLEALKYARRMMKSDSDFEFIDASIAKATGEPT